jgi:hypothetical protein
LQKKGKKWHCAHFVDFVTVLKSKRNNFLKDFNVEYQITILLKKLQKINSLGFLLLSSVKKSAENFA